jgi:hypothetical protein
MWVGTKIVALFIVVYPDPLDPKFIGLLNPDLIPDPYYLS